MFINFFRFSAEDAMQNIFQLIYRINLFDSAQHKKRNP